LSLKINECYKKKSVKEENALLFDKMLSECGQNKDFKGENYSAEVLFMLLVLQQQKMINELIAEVSECNCTL
jgi:hypothetical protein